MLIKVMDKEGKVFTMPSETPECILEIHYCTSYYTFVVQEVDVDENGKEIYPKREIIVPINEDNWLDFIAVDMDEIGSIVE